MLIETMLVSTNPKLAGKLRLLHVKKRKMSVCTMKASDWRPRPLLSYWDGGSKDLWAAWDANGTWKMLPVGGAPGFTPTPRDYVPEPGEILIKYGTFCGKPATPFIYIFTE